MKKLFNSRRFWMLLFFIEAICTLDAAIGDRLFWFLLDITFCGLILVNYRIAKAP